MALALNHTIVAAEDAERSARFVADLLGLVPPRRFGPFHAVEVANDAMLDFMDSDGEITS